MGAEGDLGDRGKQMACLSLNKPSSKSIKFQVLKYLQKKQFLEEIPYHEKGKI